MPPGLYANLLRTSLKTNEKNNADNALLLCNQGKFESTANVLLIEQLSGKVIVNRPQRPGVWHQGGNLMIVMQLVSLIVSGVIGLIWIIVILSIYDIEKNTKQAVKALEEILKEIKKQNV
jgi:hypothetical protein